MNYKKLILGLILIMGAMWVGTSINVLLNGDVYYPELRNNPWYLAKWMTALLCGTITASTGLFLVIRSKEE